MKRTDLAMEAREIWQESAEKTTRLQGVTAQEYRCKGYHVTLVRVLDHTGEKTLNKPVGTYVNLDMTPLKKQKRDDFRNGAEAIAKELRQLLLLKPGEQVLVVGLGNAGVTPDAVGPKTAERLLVTRHLARDMPEQFAGFRPVSALAPGVLGTTGLESAEVVKSVAARIRPDRIIVVDALAARSPDRLCATVQMTDTGIVPGSGVGNSREAFDQKSLGVPVCAIGIPTVVDVETLTEDLLERNGYVMPELKLHGNLIVTPSDIDAEVDRITRVVACGINLALQDGMTPEDVNYYVG